MKNLSESRRETAGIGYENPHPLKKRSGAGKEVFVGDWDTVAN